MTTAPPAKLSGIAPKPPAPLHVRDALSVVFSADTTTTSYPRTRCAAASARLSPDFAEHGAIECLDDCESETRALGVTYASDRMPMVRERIRGMAEDVTEEDCNRRMASARIAQWC